MLWVTMHARTCGKMLREIWVKNITFYFRAGKES